MRKSVYVCTSQIDLCAKLLKAAKLWFAFILLLNLTNYSGISLILLPRSPDCSTWGVWWDQIIEVHWVSLPQLTPQMGVQKVNALWLIVVARILNIICGHKF